jgi:hypothetical protein
MYYSNMNCCSCLQKPNVQFTAYLNTRRVYVQAITSLSEGDLIIANYKDIHFYEPSTLSSLPKSLESTSDEESTKKSVLQPRVTRLAAAADSSNKLKFFDNISHGTQLLYNKKTVILVPSGIKLQKT